MDWALLASLVNAGHAEQLVHAKEVAYHFFKQIFEVVDFHNDEHFYSPSLFALDSATGSSDAVLLSLAAPIVNSGGKFPFPIKATTNSNGALVIPAVGNIWTSHPNAECYVQVGPDHTKWLVGFGDNDDLRPAPLEPVQQLAPHPLGLMQQSSPLFTSDVVDVHGNRIELNDRDIVSGWADQMCRSLDLLQQLHPSYYQLLSLVCNFFILLQRPDVNSFATEKLPGVSFLSLTEENTIPYFLEDIAHQCAHNVLSTACFGRNVLFVGSENIRISDITGVRTSDTRSIYVVSHGVFTETIIGDVLLRAIKSGTLAGDELFEVQGRLAFILKKYSVDRGNVRAIRNYSIQGEQIMDGVLALGDSVARDADELCRHLDLEGQAYNFDTGLFRARNQPARGGRSS